MCIYIYIKITGSSSFGQKEEIAQTMMMRCSVGLSNNEMKNPNEVLYQNHPTPVKIVPSFLQTLAKTPF
jgi:hypothetical protein